MVAIICINKRSTSVSSCWLDAREDQQPAAATDSAANELEATRAGNSGSQATTRRTFASDAAAGDGTAKAGRRSAVAAGNSAEAVPEGYQRMSEREFVGMLQSLEVCGGGPG